MKKSFHVWKIPTRVWAGCLVALIFMLAAVTTKAQPYLVSSDPTNEQEDVSTTNTVVFVFSTTMDPTNSGAEFFDESHEGTPVPATFSWSASNTVLTYTPEPSWPAESAIVWALDAHDTNGNALTSGFEGFFVTGGSGSGSGSTNKYSTFDIGTAWSYDQTSTGAPTLDVSNSYEFLANVNLSSNRTALSNTITLPNSSVSNMTQDPFASYEFFFGATETNLTVFDNTFGSGSYVFTVFATSSNQQVAVDLPESLAQPPAPQVANFTAAQSVDASQPFTLQWDAFANPASQAFIYVTVGNAYTSAPAGDSNAIPASATSLQLPAGTLQSNTTYLPTIGFFNGVITTNGSTLKTAYREAITTFPLVTTGGASPTLVLTNLSLSKTSFSFSINAPENLTLAIQYNTNLGSSSWQTLFATNAGPGVIQVDIPFSPTNRSIFYRAEIEP